ncbi:formylglycine-generating enzyme family protein [Flexithrix dorotheae]|uniref:formylglycine-generating enzyme family protein n=1 Tax=Flexithrix dorotheae TaxID=70993 RepID=UPI00035E9B61|nr:SUMF1/EgtB/PvdO family nonheme iron enzyme [Flexithrix dorotheae]
MKPLRLIIHATVGGIFLIILTLAVLINKRIGILELLLPNDIKGVKEMVLVPGGKLTLKHRPAYIDPSGNYQKVWVSAFYMDKTPVTNQEFEEYLKAGGLPTAYWEETEFQDKNNPVTGISWYQAVDYCNWRSKAEGLSPAYIQVMDKDSWGQQKWVIAPLSNGYRLPSEIEFEYAACGGHEKHYYPWGNSFKNTFANFDNEKGNEIGNWVYLADVSSQYENDFGLLGMSGNVWEWTDDWYEEGKVKISNRKKSAREKPHFSKVLKGGSYGSPSKKFLRVASKSHSTPGNFNFDIGFRCVRPISLPMVVSRGKTNIDLDVPHQFYTPNYQITDFKNVDFKRFDDKFNKKLEVFIKENYPNCLYFSENVGKQKVLSPKELADLIIEVALNNKVNPIFLTAVLASESGFASAGLPRWFNNPLHFRWKEKPVPKDSYYSVLPNHFDRNKQYSDLRANFTAFCKFIQKEQIKAAGKSDLYDFQLNYLGKENKRWFYVFPKIYFDLAGMPVGADFPERNFGKLVYTNWNSYTPRAPLKAKVPVKKAEPKLANKRPEANTKYFLIVDSFENNDKAKTSLGKLINFGFVGSELINVNQEYNLSIAHYSSLDEAQSAQRSFSELYDNIWILEL